MSGFSPVRRAAFLVPSGPANDPDRKHLHVLLTDPCGVGKQVLMVPICSVKPDLPHDSTCLLSPGDHQFLQHASYVAYSKCRVEAAADVAKLVGGGYFTIKEPASEELIARIAAAISTSKFIKPFARDFYRDYEQSVKAAAQQSR